MNRKSEDSHSTDHAPYPNDVVPPPAAVTAHDSWTSDPVVSQPPAATAHAAWSSEGPKPIPSGGGGGGGTTTMPTSSTKKTIDSVKDVFGKWGKKSQGYAGEVWHHLKSGTRAITEGGYEKIFVTTFETVPDEKLLKYYPCYLSTPAGPVMGILYMSTAKLAFCSDNPLSYKVDEETQWSYCKVVIPLHQLKAVNPSKSKANPLEKYIQIISVDNHEYCFMGFLNYDSAVQNLQGAL